MATHPPSSPGTTGLLAASKIVLFPRELWGLGGGVQLM